MIFTIPLLDAVKLAKKNAMFESLRHCVLTSTCLSCLNCFDMTIKPSREQPRQQKSKCRRFLWRREQHNAAKTELKTNKSNMGNVSFEPSDPSTKLTDSKSPSRTRTTQLRVKWLPLYASVRSSLASDLGASGAISCALRSTWNEFHKRWTEAESGDTSGERSSKAGERAWPEFDWNNEEARLA